MPPNRSLINANKLLYVTDSHYICNKNQSKTSMIKRFLLAVTAIASLTIAGQEYTLRATKYHPGTGGAGWVTASASTTTSCATTKFAGWPYRETCSKSTDSSWATPSMSPAHRCPSSMANGS